MSSATLIRKITLLALLLGAAAFTSNPAFALPHFGIHRHPAPPADGRISVLLYNSSPHFRDLRVEGRVYTVPSQSILSIKAAEGTPVFTETTGALHRKGDVLMTVSRAMQNTTVPVH